MKKRALGTTLAVAFAVAALAGPTLGAQGGKSADANCGNGGAHANWPPGWQKNGSPEGYYDSAAWYSAAGQKAKGGLRNQGAYLRCDY